MSNDPFKDYVTKMHEVKASDRLLDDVLKRADAERCAAATAAETPASSACAEKTAKRATERAAGRSAERDAGSAGRTVHPRAKRPARLKVALAACLAALALVVGLSLTLPSLGIVGGAVVGTAFTVKAYGAMDDTLLPTGSNGMIVFNCETETQRMIPLEADEYANEGFYTGCVFSVEGENIARIQANVSRGELYRVTSKVYSRESDPEFAKEANSWKWYTIGQGEFLSKYDYVAGVPYYGTIEPDGENVGKDRNDPSRTNKVNLYQRLGSTIDTSAITDPEQSASEYRFGLWTNEPFDAAEDENSTPNWDANMNAALDTLDGAQVTITITFDDGSTATQVIDLHAADFKANVVETADGINHVLELVPQMVTIPEKSDDEAWEDYRQGVAYIHTLYGTVASETDEPFPYGEASYPYLAEPLTQPRDISRYVDAPANQPDDQVAPRETTFWDNMPPGPSITSENVCGLPATYVDRGYTVTYERIEKLENLPEGTGVTDLIAYYQAGGLVDPSLDHIENYRGYSIDAEGALSPEYSYVLLTKTVTNTLGDENDVHIAEGSFTVLGDEVDREFAHAQTYVDDPAWRSGHDGSAWDSHIYFQNMQPGETREFSLLYILPNELLERPDLAFVYYGFGGMSENEDAKAFRIGALG